MKFKNFLTKNRDYFLIIAITVAIIFSIFLVMGVFPFGTKTIAHYDMIGQTIPLSELIFDWFQGESPLFYSTSVGLGANTFGYLIYFILSPFNILTLLGGEGNLFFSVNIVFLLKLITIGCLACWFIKKYFKNVGSLITISFSILYTFCGYMLFNYTYLSFIDYLIYAPIFIYTFTLLKDKNKIWPMSLIVFLMILSCFSLGCFTLIYLSVIFSLYVFLAVKKEDRKDLILKTISSTLIGIALASPILVPAFWQFLHSSRNTEVSIFNSILGIGTPTKISVIVTDIVALFFGIMYFVKCDKKDGFNKFLMCVGILTLITTFSDESLKLFNGGATFGYYSRFGFVGAILTLSLGCLYFDKIYKPAEKVNKHTIVTNYILSSVYMVVFILLVCIFKQAVSIMIRAQQVTWHGLVIYLPIFVMVLVPILLTVFTQKTTKNQLKIMAGIIAIITACGGGIFHLTNNTNDTVIYSQATQCLEQIDKNYRVKFISDNYLSFNATTLGVKSLNSFSSLSHKNLNSSLNNLGYNAATNWVKSCGGTVLSDIFVGNKYVLSEYKINYSYLKLIEEKDNCYLYENLLCGKLGKVLQSKPKFTNDFVSNQNVLFNSLGGSGNVIEKISPELILENCNVVDSFYKAQKEREAYKIKVNYNFTENKLLYLCVEAQSQEKSYNMSFENGFVIEKDCLVPIFNEDCLNINCLENMPVESLSFYEMDLQKIENLNYQDFDVKELYSGFSAEINLTENSTVFLPYINIEGYNITVNNKEVQIDSNSFVYLNLSEGLNKVEFQFKNPVTKFFLIGLLMGLILVGLGVLIYKLKNKFNGKFVNIAFIVFATTLVGVFVIFPVGVTIVKIFIMI